MLLGRTSRHVLLWCPELTLFAWIWRSLRTRKLSLLVVGGHNALALLCLLHTLHHHLLLLLWVHSCRVWRIRSALIAHHIAGHELTLCIELTL